MNRDRVAGKISGAADPRMGRAEFGRRRSLGRTTLKDHQGSQFQPVYACINLSVQNEAQNFLAFPLAFLLALPSSVGPHAPSMDPPSVLQPNHVDR